jgi:hypothetical protein
LRAGRAAGSAAWTAWLTLSWGSVVVIGLPSLP